MNKCVYFFQCLAFLSYKKAVYYKAGMLLRVTGDYKQTDILDAYEANEVQMKIANSDTCGQPSNSYPPAIYTHQPAIYSHQPAIYRHLQTPTDTYSNLPTPTDTSQAER